MACSGIALLFYLYITNLFTYLNIYFSKYLLTYLFWSFYLLYLSDYLFIYSLVYLRSHSIYILNNLYDLWII
jgi:hypothetical protein